MSISRSITDEKIYQLLKAAPKDGVRRTLLLNNEFPTKTQSDNRWTSSSSETESTDSAELVSPKPPPSAKEGEDSESTTSLKQRNKQADTGEQKGTITLSFPGDYERILIGLKAISGQQNKRLARKKDGSLVKGFSKYSSTFRDVHNNSKTVTIFDSDEFRNSESMGVYVLFWLATGFFIFNNLVHSFVYKKELFIDGPVMQILCQDLFKVALTDLVMYFSTYFAYFVQKAIQKEIISWDGAGWIIQVVYDFFFLFGWSIFALKYVMGYPWIARIFLLLHSLVFLMKMHSYAFYNGYLWRILKELHFSTTVLTKIRGRKIPKNMSNEEMEKIKDSLIESICFCFFELHYQSTATSTYPTCDNILDMTTEQFEANLQNNSDIIFPSNINLKNYFDYTMFPTLVYTLKFPRTDKIRWGYVFLKITGIFGIFFLMLIIAQDDMYPIVQRGLAARSLPNFGEKLIQYGLIVLDMIPVLLMEYILTFFIIWDTILNTIAELSRFADREFYGPWWACTDFSQFARIWNVTVHKFLQRHVYHSSISMLNFNKQQAIFATFILSSLVHELAMLVIFDTLRGYLLLFQMSQIPLVMLSNTKFMRNRRILGNIVCWVGFVIGPSLICTLYLVF
ncbi:acyl-CoA/sterol acyltransferase [Scheffersomyces spartinae]|uniref:O-acyltransferase n=1 Tax=Scheffersomyces spartinae TaxID=45513 RepID=A0A9P7V7S0_9ASCO|nr:acyl-CoA/sterol acyltransferase [Scheffersomyces spartinae]KAG7192787.1 acyl-CoA/sterol acyltransferase [Scheffersomyces spartinae]